MTSKLKHRSSTESTTEWGCASRCEYLLVLVALSILLIGALALVLFWAIYFRKGFAWNDVQQLDKQFNLHPVLMVSGFIFFSGFSMLFYRIFYCCKKLYVKLVHTVFHLLAIPCIVLGFIAVFDWHNNQSTYLPNFYSLHSWVGLTAMGLFALQFVVGFFSFLILLCCEGATEAFRAALVPVHATFGATTFGVAVAACLTGLTQKILMTNTVRYSEMPLEAVVVNALGAALVAAAVLLPHLLCRRPPPPPQPDYVSERL